MKPNTLPMINRRRLLALISSFSVSRASEQITFPVVSEVACPLERIEPVAADDRRGLGFLRKPPGNGRFPVLMIIHPGASPWPEHQLKTYSLTTPTPSRFLAAGYVMALVTYRSRDTSRAYIVDGVAAVDYLKKLPFADPKSIVLFGCSGGGDMALEVAAATEVCAIVAEEPASMGFTGVFDSTGLSKKVDFTPADGAFIMKDPKSYYTPEDQKLTREKIDRIKCPILIVQALRH